MTGFSWTSLLIGCLLLALLIALPTAWLLRRAGTKSRPAILFALLLAVNAFALLALLGAIRGWQG